MKTLRNLLFATVATVIAGLPAAAHDHTNRHLLFVSGRDALVTYDIESGREIARLVTPGVAADMQVTAAGVVLLNHRDAHRVVAFDSRTLREAASIASSIGGTRPVHAYTSPVIGGRQFFVALFDGDARATQPGVEATDSSALFIDITAGSPTYLQRVGEVRLGNGHHKIAFSPTAARFSVSNIADCDEILGIYDYSNLADIRRIAVLDAAALGLDGSTPARSCDAGSPPAAGTVRPAPHGTTTSSANGHQFHNLNGTGQFVIISNVETTPAFRAIQTTGGSGGAYIKPHPAGRFLYAPQNTPREGAQGARAGGSCQIGQIAVIDAVEGRIAREVPLRYDGPDCTRSLAGTEAASNRPAFATVSPDGRTLFVTLGTLGQPNTRARQIAVFDLSDPASPRQLPSIAVGASEGHRDMAITGDGRLLVVPSNVDNTVQVIDMVERAVIRSFPVVAQPNRVATFDPRVGPSQPSGPVRLSQR